MYNYEIPTEILERYNIDYDEFLLLLLVSRGRDLQKLKESLLYKDTVRENKFGVLYTKRRERIIVECILSDYKRYLKDMKKRSIINPEYIEYAEEMQQLYPKGTRPGCSTKWRGNKLVIAKKLTTLSRDFGVSFTKEQAIDITRRYVESFNGDLTYMECLEYFVLRERPNFKSSFLSYLEDEEEPNNSGEELLNLRN